jgi:hypothetical protein
MWAFTRLSDVWLVWPPKSNPKTVALKASDVMASFRANVANPNAVEAFGGTSWLPVILAVKNMGAALTLLLEARNAKRINPMRNGNMGRLRREE